MEPLISVIVPIYNVEKYLNRCIESIVNQIYKNLEIILVDDGSPDNCPQICDEWKEKDNRIKVIHKENGGLSDARNAGIRNASGEYISFVDADDTIEINTYLNIKNVINQCKPDIIDFGWQYVSKNNEITKNINKLGKNTLLSKNIIIEIILPPLLNIKDKEYFVFDFVWNKVFKSEIIYNYNVLFNDKRRTWEDRIFLVEFLKYANTYYAIDGYFYNYMDIPNSLSRVYSLDFFDLIIENYLFYYNNFSGIYDFDTDYVNNYWSDSIENMIFRSLAESTNREIIKGNIKRTLLNNQVIQWYSKRTCTDKFTKLVTKHVINKNVSKAIYLYTKKYKQNVLKEKIKVYKYSIRKMCKKIIKRK